MKTALYHLFAGILVLAGLGLLYPANAGFLPLGESYVRGVSHGLPNTVRPVAFVGVDVVPMDRERVLRDRTVVVREGRISAVGPRDGTDVPDGARVVRGEGLYLMPGLVDMHVHVEDEDDLLLYAANGVTGVRNMWGNTGLKSVLGYPDQLALREEVEAGDLLGPRIHTAGPIMEGEPASTPMMPTFTSPDEARESVARQAKEGYDYVKVYDNLSSEVYHAIVDEARRREMPVVGHAPERVGLDAALENQLSIEHLTGYLDPDAAELAFPEGELDEYAARTREAGVWNCPTIGLYEKLVPDDRVEGLERSTEGSRYVSPLTRATWQLFLPQMRADIGYGGEDYPTEIRALYLKTTRALHEADAEIVAGTDASNPYLVPGFSLHDELENLTVAGLSPYEALEAATANAAEALGEGNGTGTVAAGKRADLILTRENPLQDVANARDPTGVVLAGRWLPEERLQELLDGLAASHRPTLPERLWPLAPVALGGFMLLRRAPNHNHRTTRLRGAGKY